MQESAEYSKADTSGYESDLECTPGRVYPLGSALPRRRTPPGCRPLPRGQTHRPLSLSPQGQSAGYEAGLPSLTLTARATDLPQGQAGLAPGHGRTSPDSGPDSQRYSLSPPPLTEDGAPLSLVPVPAGGIRSRRRRDRTRFTPADLGRLEAYFSAEPYPDIHGREALAAELRVTEDRIQVWFQNRRSKTRRHGSTRARPAFLPRQTHPGVQPQPRSPPGGQQPYPATVGGNWGTSVTIHGNMIVHSNRSSPPSDAGQGPVVCADHTRPCLGEPRAADPAAPEVPFVPRRPWETPSPPSRKRARTLHPSTPEDDVISQAPADAGHVTRQALPNTISSKLQPGLGSEGISAPGERIQNHTYTAPGLFGTLPGLWPSLSLVSGHVGEATPGLRWPRLAGVCPTSLSPTTHGYLGYQYVSTPLAAMPLYGPLVAPSAGVV